MRCYFSNKKNDTHDVVSHSQFSLSVEFSHSIHSPHSITWILVDKVEVARDESPERGVKS